MGPVILFIYFDGCCDIIHYFNGFSYSSTHYLFIRYLLFVQFLIYRFMHLFIYWPMYLLVIHSSIYSFISYYSFIYSLVIIHLCIHPFIYLFIIYHQLFTYL